MNNNKLENSNYLNLIPVRNNNIEWSADENGIVTLKVENKGVFNRITQKLLNKPKFSYIHLDENGSFVWPLIDGEKDITAIGKLVDEHFGEKSHPLYERLFKFFKILYSYKFIGWK